MDEEPWKTIVYVVGIIPISLQTDTYTLAFRQQLNFFKHLDEEQLKKII